MIARDAIYGIYPMLYAFFDREGRLDRTAMRRQVEGCLRAKPHGIAVMGLATEVGKLQTMERRMLLDWVAEDIGGMAPLAVTVVEPSVQGQIEFAAAARSAGASWVILQPPPIGGLAEIEYLRFFGKVADRCAFPVAVQNAAQYIGIGLSIDGLRALHRNHPNVSLLKGEGPAHVIERTIADTEGAFRVFNGRGGLELTDNLRAGCVGMIPGAETVDVQVRIYELMRGKLAGDGSEAEAERLYALLLPLIAFIMSSLDTFLCYGKRLAARRFSIGETFDRDPAQRATPFGLAMLDRLSRHLGPL
jgi:4-hydroxy-tetrahydrodipicolinate synthase